ncbi:hypothetical protein TRFO_04471 [Tritrichomonas foetus]|uniref:Uncharacterized protein n=1 Tax=Tritrichomonas foetus TaxID=1144522 RepID=A0A1J4KFF8_9EUKA|nr:hypothetical protein TRFO_04471 [Tritrichomonas foetus]|eukprot:OHT09915.1 hypothetical protein TRFO_04471 [Tritrichomonas foetus]
MSSEPVSRPPIEQCEEKFRGVVQSFIGIFYAFINYVVDPNHDINKFLENTVKSYKSNTFNDVYYQLREFLKLFNYDENEINDLTNDYLLFWSQCIQAMFDMNMAIFDQSKHKLDERLDENIIKLQSTLGELYNQCQQVNQSLKQENSNLKHQNADMKGENQKLKDENQILKDENQKLQDENLGLKDNNLKLKEDIINLKNCLQQAEEMQNSFDKINKQLTEKKSQYNLLLNHYEQKNEEMENLRNLHKTSLTIANQNMSKIIQETTKNIFEQAQSIIDHVNEDLETKGMETYDFNLNDCVKDYTELINSGAMFRAS